MSRDWTWDDGVGSIAIDLAAVLHRVLGFPPHADLPVVIE